MKYPHWEYYLAMINDIDEIFRYIQPCEENYNTFSIELARLLLAAGSEIDVVCKVLCKKTAPSRSPQNINEYKTILLNEYPLIHSIEIAIPKYSISLTPWSEWSGEENPVWWKSYNEVKHQRNDCFHEANLINVLNAMGGLCVLISYLYHDFFSERCVIKRPSIFLAGNYTSKGKILFGQTYTLPDFPSDESDSSQE